MSSLVSPEPYPTDRGAQEQVEEDVAVPVKPQPSSRNRNMAGDVDLLITGARGSEGGEAGAAGGGGTTNDFEDSEAFAAGQEQEGAGDEEADDGGGCCAGREDNIQNAIASTPNEKHPLLSTVYGGDQDKEYECPICFESLRTDA